MFGGPGTSADPCSNNYRGPHPWSEPETLALRNYLMNTTFTNANWMSFITVHSYGQYILIPYSFDNSTYPADFEEMEKLANETEVVMKSVHGTPFEVGHSGSLLGIK
jgi:hypothetical protein